MRRLSSTLAPVAVAGLLFAACGDGDSIGDNIAEEAIEQAGGGDVDINTEDGSVSVENEDGSFSVDEEGNVEIETEDGSFSASGELPDDFPDVPMPDGFEVQSGSQTSSPDGEIFNVTGLVEGDAADVFAELVAQYEDDGYSVENKSETNTSDGFMGGATFTNDDHTVSLSVFGDSSSDETTVNITVQPPQE